MFMTSRSKLKERETGPPNIPDTTTDTQCRNEEIHKLSISRHT